MSENGNLLLTDDDLRRALTDATLRRTGFAPRDFQLDAAATLCKGRDLIVNAGTGFGKTLCMVMPCFLSSSTIAFIISPLNALEEDQVSFIFVSISITLTTVLYVGSEIP